MNRLSLNPTSWPIALKFTVAALVIMVALYAGAFTIQRQRLIQLVEAEARSYIAQEGTRQLQAITAAVNGARQTLDRYVDDPGNLAQLQALLIGQVNSNIALGLPSVSVPLVESRFRSALLDAATTPFESIRLLDASGQVRVRAQLGGRAGAATGDESNTPAFRAAAAALLQGQTRLFNAVVETTPIIEYIYAIQWRDGRTLGFLIARLSNARVLFSNLRFTESDLPAYSVLVTGNNQIIAPVEFTQRFQVAINDGVVSRAAQGRSGVEIYPVGSGGVSVAGFYGPVAGTPLVLVAQTPLDRVLSARETQLVIPSIVLAVGGFTLLTIIVIVLTLLIVPPINRLRRVAERVTEGDYGVPVTDAQRGDEIGALASSMVTLRDTVRSRVADLETRVTSRGRDIAATQEISRYAATQRDLQLLMDRVVELIVERFPVVYHAQIFLIDEEGRYAIVRASTGEVGRQLVARGHRLAVGSISVIGQVTDQRRTIVARDTSASQIHRRNEFLPETRAELAVPLIIGDRVIGALDVQSKEPDAFSDDLVTVLQTMADQIAIAIENARLYQESLRRVADIEAANRRATLAAWQDYIRVLRSSSLTRDAGVPDETTRDSEAISALRQQAIATGAVAIGQPTARATIPVAVPLILRGQILGAVEWELPQQTFNDEKIELARELANRLAVSMDNARLFQESQRNAERERLVNAIAARLTTQTSIDSILQLAVREVGQALRVPNVSIRLRPIAVGSGLAAGNGGGSGGSANGSNGNGTHDVHTTE
ncbi:MAG: GAF domain-containing protein [Candidatus Flexifilum sp.]|jgi:GAF domain-containing protein/HAMP domain-containing protein